MYTDAGAPSASYSLSEEGLLSSGLPPFVADKIRRVATEHPIVRFQVEQRTAQGERVTLWCETVSALWFYQGGSAAWANVDGAYTTFDRIPDTLRQPPPPTDEVWWLRLSGEREPYVLEVSCLTLRWGK
jgi:hypothetical protein